MELIEARLNLFDELLDRDMFNENYYWVAIADTNNPDMKAIRLVGLAAKLCLWNEAEILFNDPTILETPITSSNDILTTLGIFAVKNNDYEQAESFFKRIINPKYDMDIHILDGLLSNNRLEEAENILRSKGNFSALDNGGIQRRLRNLVYNLCEQDQGPKRALELVIELVPSPKTSDIADKQLEKSRWDYFLENIPVAALMHNDEETAHRAINLMYDMVGGPAAMGGGGILDEAYATEDESIVNAVKELIRNKQNSQTV